MIFYHLLFHSIFDQTNVALVNIRDFQKHHTNPKLFNYSSIGCGH